MERDTHTIDATGKPVGRLASQVAVLLRGKHKPTFERYKDCGDAVKVYNLDLMRFTGSKLAQKVYYRHSGYPGGLKQTSAEELMRKDPAEVLRRAVYGMLPKNKLRPHMIKRLSTYRGQLTTHS